VTLRLCPSSITSRRWCRSTPARGPPSLRQRVPGPTCHGGPTGEPAAPPAAVGRNADRGTAPRPRAGVVRPPRRNKVTSGTNGQAENSRRITAHTTAGKPTTKQAQANGPRRNPKPKRQDL
jgi:hypothetical protein